MSQPQLTVFLDIVSPFAYMAFHVTSRSEVFKSCKITYIPIFLGGVMKACDNRPPIEIKHKAQWIDLERRRWAKYCSIPMCDSLPGGFPPNTLHVMRALCAIQTSHPARLTAAFEALYAAMWEQGLAAHEPEIFGPVLSSVLGEAEANEVLNAAARSDAKTLLKENTEVALGEGAFGLPWFVAINSEGEKESYWGFDHLGQVIDHLGLDRGAARELRAML